MTHDILFTFSMVNFRLFWLFSHEIRWRFCQFVVCRFLHFGREPSQFLSASDVLVSLKTVSDKRVCFFTFSMVYIRCMVAWTAELMKSFEGGRQWNHRIPYYINFISIYILTVPPNNKCIKDFQCEISQAKTVLKHIQILRGFIPIRYNEILSVFKCRKK